MNSLKRHCFCKHWQAVSNRTGSFPASPSEAFQSSLIKNSSLSVSLLIPAPYEQSFLLSQLWKHISNCKRPNFVQREREREREGEGEGERL